jgi:negative regulator of flagellin synthesis FlgM
MRSEHTTMRSIDRAAAQDAARSYSQSTEATRAAAAAAASQNTASPTSLQTRAPRTDSVTLSDNARSVGAARQAVKNSPDVRQQKVADIKQQLTDGTYQVASHVLARKLMNTSSIQA